MWRWAVIWLAVFCVGATQTVRAECAGADLFGITNAEFVKRLNDIGLKANIIFCLQVERGCQLEVAGFSPIPINEASACFDGFVVYFAGMDRSALRASIAQLTAGMLKALGATPQEVAQAARLAEKETAPPNEYSIVNPAWRLPGVSCCFVSTSASTRGITLSITRR